MYSGNFSKKKVFALITMVFILIVLLSVFKDDKFVINLSSYWKELYLY